MLLTNRSNPHIRLTSLVPSSQKQTLNLCQKTINVNTVSLQIN